MNPPNDADAVPDLESRYRRLLAWYPWSHRRRYEDEMVAVLLAGARDSQRRPDLADSAGLVAAGIRARVRAAVVSLAGPAWVDAAAVFGLLAALVVLSHRVTRLVGPAIAGSAQPVDVHQYLRTVGWAAVVVAVVVGLRRLAAVLVWTTVLGEAVLLARYYDIMPVSAVNLFWPFALSVVVAATLTLPAPRRHAFSVLRASRLLAFILGLCLVQAIRVINRHQDLAASPGGSWYVFYQLQSPSEAILHLLVVVIGVGALIAALAVLTLPPAVRWRIAVLIAPIVTVAAVVELSLDGWAYSNGSMGHPIYLVPGQWTALVALPLAAFGLGAALMQRREHLAELAALGRTVDRERLDS